MASCASVGNLILLRHGRRYEAESMATHERIGKGLLNAGHVARQAIAARAAGAMVGMRFDANAARSIGGLRPVAFQTHPVARLDQVGVVFRPMRVMTGSAGNTSSKHQALHEIVTLHSILVSSAVSEVSERGFTQLVIFQLPERGQVAASYKSDRPVIGFPCRLWCKRPALRVALDAGIRCVHHRQPGGVYDCALRRMGNVPATGSMTLFAADIPFRH